MKKRALLAALLTVALAQPLRAQESADETKKAAAVLDEARQHVAKAKVHYDLGEFKEAADEYIIVYRLRPIPALLFNIAQAYRQGGLYDKARQFYKSYLRESPDAKNRATIEQSIREMDELLAKEKHTREAPPAGVKEPSEASLPLPAKPAPGTPAPAKVAETTRPAEPAKVPELPKPAGEASSPKPDAVAAAKTPPPLPGTKSAPSASTAPGAPPALASKPPAPSTTPAPSATPASKPPATVAVATPRPSAPPAATPSTQAPPHPVAEESEGGVLTKWWFWTAVGVVALGGGGVLATQLGGNAAPGSHYGNHGI